MEDKPLEEGLENIGVRFLQTLRLRRSLVKILLTEISRYPRQVRTIHQQMIDNQARILEDFLER